MNRLAIARVAHEINRAYCASQGDDSPPAWDDAPEWQQQSILAGVDMHLANPDATPEQSHESWLAQKANEGWAYGMIKDADRKLHPCFLPYAELPPEQRAKDYLFRAVVHALKATPEVVAIAPAPKVVDGKLGFVPVRYIGRRPEWSDRLYGSGLSFETNQVRVVPGALARSLLRHRDIFEPVDAMQESAVDTAVEQPTDDTAELLEQGEKNAQKSRDDENRVQDLKDQISQMQDKDLLKEFALVNYRQQLPKTLTVENMRTKIIGMIDQFGPV